ncbi:juvenile hormone esterase-like [Anopheles nili]|uniref:juvenile hormone esterase-like n=1 Tax=Anopheles nili TaxID=185578 RepID=UPI00237A72E0|nr:juvenile hormone esterase-like [Anopheles nili]
MSTIPIVIVKVILLVSFAVASGIAADQTAPRVCIEDGCMRGSWMRSFLGRRYQAFVGVPFAKPPVGPLRFAGPVPNEPWTETELDATGNVQREPCIQLDILLSQRGVEGSEDCLYLNVYSPMTSTKGSNSSNHVPIPTLVFIHPGAFMVGYNSPLMYNAEKLMDHSVILVTIPYRLGAFGFLSTSDEAASGNFGLKDQRLALQWIQKNIHAFGGDPKLVTLLGSSAGGASVHLHLMHLQNEGLFQRAISLSGNALAAWSTPKKNPEQTARKQAALVGIQNSDQLTTSELIQALRSVDANQIAKSYSALTVGQRKNRYFFQQNGSPYHMLLYGPVIEPSTVEDAFLTAHPKDLWSHSEKYLSVPWLTGIVPNDGFVFSFPILKDAACSPDIITHQKRMLFNLLGGTERPDIFPFLSQRFSTKFTSIGECFTKDNVDILTQIFNEALFAYPLFLSVRQHSHNKQRQNPPIFLYKFSYKGERSYSTVFVTDDSLSRDFGIVHVDDLLYIFRSPVLFPTTRRSSPDAKASQRFNELLVHFARTGIAPNGKDVGHLEDSSHDLDTNDAEFPLAFELINTNRTDEPVAQRFVDLYDEEMISFWKSYYGD